MMEKRETMELAPGIFETAYPFQMMRRFTRDMERMFEDFWKRPFFGLRRPEFWRAGRSVLATMPAVDVYQEKDDVIVKAELPGLSKDDIQVNLTDSTLTIRGERKKEEEVNQDDYFYSERSQGAFARNIDLPAEVKPDQVKATFKDGILQIRLPKTEESKRKATSIKIN